MKESEGRYRCAEIMPYHAMGISESEAMGIGSGGYQPGADFADGWQRAFAELGCQVKVTT